MCHTVFLRHKVALAGVVASLVVGAWAAPPSPQTTKATAHKKTSSYHHSARATTSAKTTTAKTAPKTAVTASKSKPTVSRSTTPKQATSKSAAKKRAVVARHYTPQQPTPERYKEIQQALAARGYFSGEPDGNWGASSVDALKRFQHDQNLVEDGKIGSLALIALGLGPKRDTPEQPQKAVETEQKIP